MFHPIQQPAINGEVDDEHKQADSNLHRASEATGIDYRNEIVFNEVAAVS